MKKLLLILALSALLPTAVFADASTYLNFTAVNGPATVALDSVGTPNSINLQYSTNNCATWNTYTIGDIISLASGATVYFKADGQNPAFGTFAAGISKVSYYHFVFSDSVAADGNIMSLLDETMTATAVPTYAFCGLFYACQSLTQAPALPATTLGNYCYSEMFYYCASLKSAPALPATALAQYCYRDMFVACESLLSAPALPADTLFDYCYRNMFGGCYSLSSPPALPATKLAKGCYYSMFAECTSFTQLPDLPADSLPDECYRDMFYKCSSLVLNTDAPGKEWSIQASSVGNNSLLFMFNLTAGTMSGTPLANTSYYLVKGGVIVVDTASADVSFHCEDVIDSVPVTAYNLVLYKMGSNDTIDIHFSNDTSFVINRLPRAVHIIDSVTGNTTTVTITINHSASEEGTHDVNVHFENLAANSTYSLVLMPLSGSGEVLDTDVCTITTSQPTPVDEVYDDVDEVFFPSEDTDVYTIDGRYLGKYHDSLPPAIYIMWENGKAHKFAKTR